jgi:hypothetical protein
MRVRQDGHTITSEIYILPPNPNECSMRSSTRAGFAMVGPQESGGALVRVTHSGLAQERVAREDYKGGWLGVLETFKNFVEKTQMNW